MTWRDFVNRVAAWLDAGVKAGQSAAEDNGDTAMLSPATLAELTANGLVAYPAPPPAPTIVVQAPPLSSAADPEPTPIDHMAVAAALAPAVTAAVQASPAVANNPTATADVVSGVLQAIAAELPTALQVSRASPKTTAEIGMGLGFFQLIAAIFAHH